MGRRARTYSGLTRVQTSERERNQMGAIEEKIARFIVETPEKDIPQEAIESAKLV